MNLTRIKVLFLFGGAFVLSLVYHIWPAAIVFGFVSVVGFLVTSKESNDEWDDQLTHGDAGQEILCYYGDELDFTDEIIINCLTKHLPYFLLLNHSEKDKFVQRLKEFIISKTFKIHDKSGFREMPVLISATAIQLSFGLKNYLLAGFKYIHIYPEEFINTSASNHFLEGNVSGQSINISWKHFLEGFTYPDDGENVGLHEMAHAYYYENFMRKINVDSKFISYFSPYNNIANKVFEQEKKQVNNLFSDYALRNLQEFWAESVEVFFEKPVEMRNHYPQLYDSMKSLLNQDPINHIPVLSS